MKNVNTQRVGFLVLLPSLLSTLNGNVNDILAAAKLPVDALNDPEAFIPYEAAGRLLFIAAESVRCPHIGLLLGQHIHTATLGLVGKLMQTASTLGQALGDFASQQHHNARGGMVYLLQKKEQAFFGYAIYQPNIEGNAQICDAAAMAAYTLVRELGFPARISGLGIMISRKPPADLAPYESMFEADVHFNSSQTGAFFHTSCLALPIAGADSRQHKAYKDRLQAHTLASGFTTGARVRREVRVGLLTGAYAGDQLAENLKMNRRTLHRRLANEGLTIQQILDETRCELALQLLAYTGLSVAEIGKVLQYAEAGVFTRAFVRWTGKTPTAWRQAALSKAD